MTRRQVRSQLIAAQTHLIPIMQNPANRHSRISAAPRRGMFNSRHVRIHNHYLRTRHFFRFSQTRAMVPVRMADQQDLDIPKLETELFHAGLDQVHRIFKIRID